MVSTRYAWHLKPSAQG